MTGRESGSAACSSWSLPGALLLDVLQVARRGGARLGVALGGAELALGGVEPLRAEQRDARQQMDRRALLGFGLREPLLERVERGVEALLLQVDLTEQDVRLGVGESSAALSSGSSALSFSRAAR